MEAKNHLIEKENHLPIFEVYIMEFICMPTWDFYYKNDDFEMFSDVLVLLKFNVVEPQEDP